MLYRKVNAVCSEIHTKHINTLCGQNVETLHVKIGSAVHKGTTGHSDAPIPIMDPYHYVNILFILSPQMISGFQSPISSTQRFLFDVTNYVIKAIKQLTFCS
jgi:hypothetical protein